MIDNLSAEPPRMPRPTRPPTTPTDTRRAVVVIGTVIAAAHDAIDVRTDDGRVWTLTGPVPDELIVGSSVQVVTDAREAGRRPATPSAGIRSVRVLGSPG